MTDNSKSVPFVDRELSWLSFSERVLQELEDPSVPLLERLFFLGIFSSNLDEFFRVRVASLRAFLRTDKAKAKAAEGDFEDPRVLHEIHTTVVGQQERYGRAIGGIMSEMRDEGILLVDDHAIPEEHHALVRDYFEKEVRPHLDPVFLESGHDSSKPFLRNRVVYLAVQVWPLAEGETGSWSPKYALLEVPSPPLPRFFELPSTGDGTNRVIFVDDIIRFCCDDLFPDHEVGQSYAIKLNRDADLGLDDADPDVGRAIEASLHKRETGVPSRFLYDMRAPYDLVRRLQEGLDLENEDLVLGGRYHNLHDFMGFPRFGRSELSYAPHAPHAHPALDEAESVLGLIRERDQVIHTPYQSFNHVVRFLDEAAADPDVEDIWLTVYRVARDSKVLSALHRAAEAGKRVTVFMEFQARFDEETNLIWAERLEDAGARILHPLPGLKVHAKIALAARREDGNRELYAYVGTGNFNEKTAGIYGDHGVFTHDPRITKDVEQVFLFLAGEVDEPKTEHLLVAPFTLRKGFNALIEGEIEQAKAGATSGMTLKMNSLQDKKIIKRLYEASQAGVPIQLIVRGICCLVPGLPGWSETIRARSVLDRYLEHARIYSFHAGGEERTYLASADWMTRNLSHRVEVALPLYDDEVRRQVHELVRIQLVDNVKARVLDAEQSNRYVEAADGADPVQSQEAFRDFVAGL